jgi:hypothetical protein
MLRKEVMGLALTLIVPNAILSFAAEVPELAPGSPVRVLAHTVTEHPPVATLTALDDTALTLSINGRADVLVVARGAITKVEVSLGRRSRGKGALIGAGMGIGAGALLGLLHGSDDSSKLIRLSAGEYALGVATLVGPWVLSSEQQFLHQNGGTRWPSAESGLALNPPEAVAAPSPHQLAFDVPGCSRQGSCWPRRIDVAQDE